MTDELWFTRIVSPYALTVMTVNVTKVQKCQFGFVVAGSLVAISNLILDLQIIAEPVK